MRCLLYTFTAPRAPWGEIKVARVVDHAGDDFVEWADQYIADSDGWITGMRSCSAVDFIDERCVQSEAA